MTTEHRYIRERIAGQQRKAQLRPCPRCGAQILTGLDHDRTAAIAHVDAAPIDPAREVAALGAGYHTYDLINGETVNGKLVSGELCFREPWHRGITDHPIHVSHHCRPLGFR
jgi:hypothetical protein